MNTVIVNGREYEVANTEKLVLDYLREDLKLTGTKRGCDEKACGACTILIDKKATRSCSIKMSDVLGKELITVEGLSLEGSIDAVQQAFIDNSAVQCGFCTPGLLMATHGLLAQTLEPSDEEIIKALRINLCRCGTYPRIIAAVKQAAKELLEGHRENPEKASLPNKGNYVGKSIVRVDYMDKVKGETKFFADYYFDDMLYGQAVYSEYPHAEILAIDTSEAENIEGVELVLTHKDIPGSPRYGGLFPDQQVLCDKRVKFMGDMVAVVFANSDEAARKGREAVHVEYRELPGVFTIEEALAKDAPIIPDADGPVITLDGTYGRGEKGNICREVELKRGNIEESFAQSDVVVEGDFTTPWEEHAWIEVDGTVSRYDENGVLSVYAPNQDPFGDHEQLVEVLGLKPDEVRVIHTPCGGGFGGKLELTTHALVAMATMKTGRPARMVLDRKDSIRTHSKRHPYKMKYKIGLNNDGKIQGLQVRAFSDAGPYISWSPRIIEQSLSWGGGPYEIPVIDMEGTTVYTNNVVCGSFRGFGANQTHFAMESILDMAAKEIGMDPITIREINALDYGKMMTTGQIMGDDQGINYLETLKMLRKNMEEKLIPMKKAAKNGEYLGIGVASGYRSIGGGMARKDVTGAEFELLESGKVAYRISCVEMGAGSITSLLQMSAEVCGVSVDQYEVTNGDTANVPYGGHVSASRGVFLWGHPTMVAGKEFKHQMLESSAKILNCEPRDLDIENNFVISQKDGKQLMSLKKLAQNTHNKIIVRDDFEMPVTHEVRKDANENKIEYKDYRPHYTASYTTTGVVVKVDANTGEVSVLHATSITEAGEIINPEAATTQIEGCVVMGMGYALNNQFTVEKGVIQTDSLGRCRIPRINNIPKTMDILFAEEFDPSAPMGAKGLAEIGILSVPPAITNAIDDAIGLRIHDLPVNNQKNLIKKRLEELIG